MSKSTLRASAAPFAHLFGGGARAAKAEGDDKSKDEKDKDAKKAKRAATEDDDMRAEEPDTETVDGDEDEGVDGDETPDLEDVEDPDDSIDEDAAPEEDDVEPKVKKAAKSGRKAERGRWTKVMSHSSAAGREAAALTLLANGKLDSRSIVATLRTLPVAAAPATPAARSGLRDRMAASPAPRLGPDGGKPTGEQTFAEQSAAAMAKVRPARR